MKMRKNNTKRFAIVYRNIRGEQLGAIENKIVNLQELEAMSNDADIWVYLVRELEA